MEYPNLYKEQIIEMFDLPFMMLKDDDDRILEFPMRLTPPPAGWMVGDTVAIEPVGARRKGEEKALYKAINKNRKQEAGVVWSNQPDNIKKSLDPSKSEEEYANTDVEIEIKDISGELFWLKDNSKWHVYPPTLDPGPWEVRDLVIVTKAIEKSKSKIYKMKNVKTEKILIAVSMGYEQ